MASGRRASRDLTSIDSPVNRHLAYLALQSLSVDDAMPPRSILVADHIARSLASTVNVFSGISPSAQRVIDAHTWRALLTGEAKIDPMRAIYFGLDECLLQLHSFKHRMRAQEAVPSSFDPYEWMSVDEARALIETLRAKWSGRQQSQQRIPMLADDNGQPALVFRHSLANEAPSASEERERGPITIGVIESTKSLSQF
jgi:hypothetical protein